MRQNVTVDGVTLTREQVERAMKELNEPEQPLRAGTKLKIGEATYVVLDKWAQAKLQMAGVYDGAARIFYANVDTGAVLSGNEMTLREFRQP